MNDVITTKDIMEDNKKCSVFCLIYITNLPLDNFGKEMIRLSKKYKNYKIEKAAMQLNPEKIGYDFVFKIIKK